MSIFNFSKTAEEAKKETFGGDFLERGAYVMKVAKVEAITAKTGNKAIVISFDSGKTMKSGDPLLMKKSFYVLDKAKGNLEFHQSMVESMRNDIIKCFGVDVDQYLTPKSLSDIAAVEPAALNLGKLIKGKEASVTIDYEEGSKYLDVIYVNSKDSIDAAKAAFEKRPVRTAAVDVDTAPSPGNSAPANIPDAIDNLPF